MRKERVQLRIEGMLCENCPKRIEKCLRRHKGVLLAEVHDETNTAEAEIDADQTSAEELAAVIEELGYTVSSGEVPEAARGKRAALLLGLAAVGYVLLQYTGLLNLLVPGQLADNSMGYGLLFVTGLMTSVHCIAMCGGIGLMQSLPGQRKNDPFGRRKGSAIYPSAAYNLGRVCSYTGIGVILGSIGALIGRLDGAVPTGVPVSVQGILKILAGTVMVLMGINMLGLFPVLRKVRIPLPYFPMKLTAAGKNTARRPFLIGLLNGFMPCGPLQMMWVIALASASPLRGGLSMLVFSLGTVPLMLGLGSAVSALGKRFSRQVRTAGSVLVIALGLAMLTQGGVLGGWIAPLFPQTEFIRGEETETTEPQEPVQVIRSTLQTRRYPNITVKKGIPVKWIIDAPEESITSCNIRMQIPDYGISHSFSPGDNIIEFTPLEAGKVSYSCWMGMIYGTIEVTEAG